MARNIIIDEAFEAVARPALAVCNDHQDLREVGPHHHRRDQLLYAGSGVLVVSTSQGAWVVPPERAVWIPAGVEHEVRMLGPAVVHGVLTEPDAMLRPGSGCVVLGLSPLLRQLVIEAVELPLEYETTGHAGLVMQLLLEEVRRAPVLPLSLTVPRSGPLAARCRAYLQAPNPHETIDGWASAVGLSRRAFTRRFRGETGMSFATWRQQACLLAALPRLAAGDTVTSVALDLGYDSPAAFTTMFRRILGAAPSRYFP